MPLVRISMLAGKPAAYRKAIMDGLYEAMRETLGTPDGDRFISITEHDASNFQHGNGYGVERTENVVYIQITVFDTRTREQKIALFKRIVERLGADPGLRPEDVWVNILPSAKENWSVGNGVPSFI